MFNDQNNETCLSNTFLCYHLTKIAILKVSLCIVTGLTTAVLQRRTERHDDAMGD